MGCVENAGIRISMDGRRSLCDNIFVVRLWRTVKYHQVYLQKYRKVQEAREQLALYFHFYNTERPDEALSYRRPHEVYFGTRALLENALERRVC